MRQTSSSSYISATNNNNNQHKPIHAHRVIRTSTHTHTEKSIIVKIVVNIVNQLYIYIYIVTNNKYIYIISHSHWLNIFILCSFLCSLCFLVKQNNVKYNVLILIHQWWATRLVSRSSRVTWTWVFTEHSRGATLDIASASQSHWWWWWWWL